MFASFKLISNKSLKNMHSLKSIVLLSSCLIGISTNLIADEQDKQSSKEQKKLEKIAPPTTKKLYKTVDKNGKVHFSDQPSPGAKAIVIEEVTSITMDKPKVDIESLVEENQIKRDPNAAYYRVLSFVGLEDDGVVRNNGGTVPLKVVLEPQLSKSHYLKFYIDGQLVGEKQKALEVVASNIEYGPHTAYFQVIASTGKLVQQSETVTFNLLHVVRKRVSNLNSLTNDVHNKTLPQHPKVPSYDSMKKTDN
jgi:predicted AAA+ superfamily ATPase